MSFRVGSLGIHFPKKRRFLERVPRLRRQPRPRLGGFGLEPLEPRLALSAVPIESPASGDLIGGWNAIVLDADGDNLFVRATQEVVNGDSLRDVFSYSSVETFAPASSGFVFNNPLFESLLISSGALTTIPPTTDFPASNSWSSPAFPTAADPDGPGGITPIPGAPLVAGTLRGTIAIDGLPASLEFTTQALVDSGTATLVFRNNQYTWGLRPPNPIEAQGQAGYYLRKGPNAPPSLGTGDIAVAGTLNFNTGVISLSFLEHVEINDGSDYWIPYTPAQVAFTATAYQAVDAQTPSLVQAVPGRDFNVGLQIDLPGDDSEIQINSTVSGLQDIRLRATNVLASAPLSTTQNMFISSRGATDVERIIFDGPVVANQIGITLADDTGTTSRNRGLLSLTPQASITASNMLVNAVESDIRFEGQVTVTSQSYSFQTSTRQTPFEFVTTNSSGVSVGQIAGNEIDVLLTNLDPVEDADVITHVVSLDTNLNGIRIGATYAETEGGLIPPYRYAIDIREQGSVSFDAAVVSGGPVSFTSGGDVTLNAAIRNFADFNISAQGQVIGDASIASVGGDIRISGTNLDLNGALQTFDRPIDERLSDIELTASAGNIDFRGDVSAVNIVSLEAFGQGQGNVRGDGRMTAGQLLIDADGSVDLLTASPVINVRAGDDVSIADAAATEINVQSLGLVSLSADGVDPVGQPSAVALEAVVRGTSEVSFAAPNGSINAIVLDVQPSTANPGRDVIVGDRQALLDGTATPTGAAGNVQITTEIGDVVVLDAPRQGYGTLRARVASEGNLVGSYAQNNPGITPATLTANPLPNGRFQNINQVSGLELVFPNRDQTAAVNLLARDLVLLRNQANPIENGLYQLMQLGGPLTPWQMRRVPTADTTAELIANTNIAILDGLYAGKSAQVTSYSNAQGVTPLQVTQGLARSPSEIVARFATSVPLDGVYAAAGPGSTITANPTSLGQLQINGQDVQVDDIILVWRGTINDDGPRAPGSINGPYDSYQSNGVYKVIDDGSAGGLWQLERYKSPVDETPANDVVVEEAIVVVSEGRYRTALTGKTFNVAYDGLGMVGLSFASPKLAMANIGSLNPRSTTNFVVSTNGGTNNAPGSLGKALSIIGRNEAKTLVGEDVVQQVSFANSFASPSGPNGRILLQQELPVVDRPIVVDSTSRFLLNPATTGQIEIEIDGSRITATNDDAFVVRGTEVNGLVLEAAASPSKAAAENSGEQTVFRGVTLRGFSAGSAVKLDGVSNVLVRDVTIGRGGGGEIGAGSRVGIQVKDAGGDGPVTITNLEVFSSLVYDGYSQSNPTSPLVGEGLRIEGSSQGIQVVGGSYGERNGTNLFGIVVDSTNTGTDRYNSIGVNPVAEVIEELGGLNTVAGLKTLNIPQDLWDVIKDDLFLGQGVSGEGIAAGSEILYIDPTSRDVVFSQAMVASVADAEVVFAIPGRTQVQENYYGVALRRGATRVTNTTIANNIVDGISVGTDGAVPVAAELWAKIGAGIAIDQSTGSPSPTVLSSASNSIFGNDYYGIRFLDSVDGPAPGGGLVSIQGNYIGTDTSGASGLFNGRGDYYWEIGGVGLIPPDGFAGLVRQSADPDDDPRLDDFGGNINARLAPTESGGGSGPGIPTPPPPTPGPGPAPDPDWDDEGELPNPTP